MVVWITLALAATGVFLVLESPVSFTSFLLGFWVFLLLILAALNGWRTYCCWRLRYHLNRDALTILFGYRKIVLPLAEIRELVPRQRKSVRWAGGTHWFAYHHSAASVEGLGPAHFYATHLSPAHLIYVVTGRGCYGISLEDPRRFARYLETCRGLGSLSRQEARMEDSSLVRLPLWRDPWVVALFAAALAANLALFAYLSHRYPSLSTFLTLHFSPTGQVDRVGAKLEVFKLPGMALVVLGGNSLVGLLLHLRERYLALLVLAVAVLVQVLFWLAALQIVK